MDKNGIISSIENVQNLEHFSIDELKRVTDLYPFFLPGRLLLLKKLHATGDFEFENQLKLASAQSIDRKRIYDLIYKEQLRESISEIIEEKETSPEDSNNTSVEIPSTIKIEEEAKEKLEELPPIALTKLTTGRKIEQVDATASNEENKQPSSNSKEKYDDLEKEILQYAISYSIEKEVMDDIEDQKSEIISEDIKEAPLNDSSDNTPSYSDMLKSLEKSNQEKSQPKSLSSNQLIDNFIKSDPQITKPTKEDELFSLTNMAKLSVVDDNEFVTETLAKIYEKQGNSDKAIKAYEKLILKFPEKKPYFADRIKKLKNDKSN